MASLRSWRVRLALVLAVVGPGIITANVDNDAGGITTYSVAGSHYGYGLLWTLIPITVALIVVQEMCARMGVVTGKCLADLIRENFGVKVTFWVSIALIIANLPYVKTEEIVLPVSAEPHHALDGGKEGMDVLDRFCREVKGKLNRGEYVLMEVGQGQADAVAQLLRDLYPGAEIDIHKDLAGIERVVQARFA